MAVKFYEEIDDEKLKFAVIIAKYDGKYVFCKHKERDTLEGREVIVNWGKTLKILP